jgi:hypothetical protein
VERLSCIWLLGSSGTGFYAKGAKKPLVLAQWVQLVPSCSNSVIFCVPELALALINSMIKTEFQAIEQKGCAAIEMPIWCYTQFDAKRTAFF